MFAPLGAARVEHARAQIEQVRSSGANGSATGPEPMPTSGTGSEAVDYSFTSTSTSQRLSCETMTKSTRRFWARPSRVPLSAIGRVSP